MIRHTDTPTLTRVADARGCLAAFGGLFVASGLLALTLALTDTDAPAGARAVAAGIGLMHLAGGLVAGWGESRQALVQAGSVTIVHRRLFRPVAMRRVPRPSIVAVEVGESRDGDGDRVYRPQLRLGSGERVPLTVGAVSSDEIARAAAEAIARRLEMPERVDW